METRRNMQESQFVLDLQAEASLKAKRDSLKELLEVPFGALPADLVQRIEALADLDRVNQLFRTAIRVNRPEELPL